MIIYIKTLFLLIIFTNSLQSFTQDVIPPRIKRCLIVDSLKCQNLTIFLEQEFDNASNSELAHLYYNFGLTYNCDTVNKSINLNKALNYWDLIDYKGYRYINVYAEWIYENYLECNLDSMVFYFNKVDQLPKEYSNDYIAVYRYCLKRLVLCLRRTGDIKKSIILLENCISSNYFKRWPTKEKGLIYFELSQLYIDLHNNDSYQKAELYALKSMKEYSFIDFEKGVLENQYNLARVYELSDNPERHAIILNYYHKNYLFAFEKKDTNNVITFANAIGEFYYKLNEFENAKKWLNLSINLIENRKERVIYSSSPYLHLANINLGEKKYKEANRLIEDGLKFTGVNDFNFHSKSTMQLKDVVYPIETLKLLNLLAKTYSYGPDLLVDENVDKKSLQILDVAFNLFHDVISDADINESKYTQKRIFNELFEQMIDQTLILANAELLFSKTDQIKHSLLRYDIGNSEKESTDFSIVKSVPTSSEEDLSIIQYGFSSDSLFAVVLEADTYTAYMLEEKENIKKKIDRCKDLLKQSSNRNQLDNILFELYSTLIKPLSIATNNIRIIPAENLESLPFEALLTNESDATSFLIKEKSIHYQYSENLYRTISGREYDNKGIAASAPIFDLNPNKSYTSIRGISGDTIELYHLEHANNEVDFISDLFNSQPIHSNKKDVLHALKSNKIFHFSGHGISYSDKPEDSFLALDSDITIEDNKITLREIYDLECKNDLVVLSACETGTGKIAQSEGVLSLARGIYFAGAKSVVSTLWSVNDKTTSEVIMNFYTELKEHSRKDDALRTAKLNYLYSVDPQFSHPYYWSGIIAVGDMSPIVDGNMYRYLILCLTSLFFIFAYIKMKK